MFRYFLSLLLISLIGTAIAQSELEKQAEMLAQQQLDAYNNRDIDAFLLSYADDVKVYNFPDQLQYEGLTEMKDLYGRMFVRTPDLHCRLINRIVMGNTVIDQEEVTVSPNDPPFKAIAIYKIKDGKISEVYFIRE